MAILPAEPLAATAEPVGTPTKRRRSRGEWLRLILLLIGAVVFLFPF